MFNLSYFFCVMLLVCLIMLMMLFYLSSFIYLKYLIMLVYVSGVVVFIMYISCLCWNSRSSYSLVFLVFSLVSIFMLDRGVQVSFSEMGDFFWIYMFFGVLFSLLVTYYSLNLFKTSGSLRF